MPDPADDIVYLAAHEVGRDRIEQFLKDLPAEQTGFRTPRDHVLRADFLIAATQNDQIIGIVGAHMLDFIPLGFLILEPGRRQRGLGTALRKIYIERARERYSFVAGVIVKPNDAMVRMSRTLHYRFCLPSRNYEFIYLPLTKFGTVAFPLFFLFFGPYFLIRQRVGPKLRRLKRRLF